MRNMNFIDLFNEDWSVNWEKIEKIHQFSVMKGLEQNKQWHKEDCWQHTIDVTSNMSKLLDKENIVKGSYIWIMCMASAICHDLGKPDTTKWSSELNDWTTKNHGVVGERITRNIFYLDDIELRESVCYMVRNHMTLHHVYDNPQFTDDRFIKLSHGIVSLKYMILLNIADSLGTTNDIETEDMIYEKYDKLVSDANRLNCYDNPYSDTENDKTSLIKSFIKYEGDTESSNKESFDVYIFVGFPGCGKSTFYDNFLNDIEVVSRDVIRGELNIGGATVENGKKVVGTKEEEEKVSDVFNKRMIELCEQKKSFAIDNTNLKYHYRKDYLQTIMKYNPIVNVIYIEAPNFIKDCIERRKGEIPKSVYERMNNSFDFPQLHECNNLFIIKEKTNGNYDILEYLSDNVKCRYGLVAEKSKF